ncbi:MAG TPA: NAD(P)H-dependent oxidoreductase subunit E [Acidimicrobiia bacterium]|nr:NAD(P)H-dependent oxidoreductase subunit E [Acidimicrobiia bacterium]
MSPIPGADDILARYPVKRSALMPLLHAVQERDGYVTEAAMEEVAEQIGLTSAEVLGVCSFYSMFKRTPQGKLLVSVCTSVSCMVNGGEELHAALRERYADDPEVTVEEVECLAADDGAPVMQVNYGFHERMTPETAERIVEDYKAGRLTPRSISGTTPPGGTP